MVNKSAAVNKFALFFVRRFACCKGMAVIFYCFTNHYFFKMKYLLVFFVLFGFACNEKAEPPSETSKTRIVLDSNGAVKKQRNPYIDIDVSPMDMIYYPVDYPKFPSNAELPVARIIYSRPHMQGRVIFGNLVKYGEPWRLGANEATEIEIFRPVTIQEKKVSPGKYILYCIPQQDKWTIVFNSNLNSWGLNLDASKDVHRFTVPSVKTSRSVEYFTMAFLNAGEAAELVIAWDDVEARLPFQFSK
jgi:hypothetical protein